MAIIELTQGMSVDHIDRNPLNNQRANLRIVSLKQNARNTERHENRIGVAYDYTHNTYKAYIDQPDKPRINVGTYCTQDQAELALAQAKRELGL